MSIARTIRTIAVTAAVLAALAIAAAAVSTQATAQARTVIRVVTRTKLVAWPVPGPTVTKLVPVPVPGPTHVVTVPGPEVQVPVAAFGSIVGQAVNPTTIPTTAAQRGPALDALAQAMDAYCSTAGLVPYLNQYLAAQYLEAGCIVQGQTFPAPPTGWQDATATP